MLISSYLHVGKFATVQKPSIIPFTPPRKSRELITYAIVHMQFPYQFKWNFPLLLGGSVLCWLTQVPELLRLMLGHVGMTYWNEMAQKTKHQREDTKHRSLTTRFISQNWAIYYTVQSITKERTKVINL